MIIGDSSAKLNGINVIGSLGVMVLAKDGRFIESIREDLEKLVDSNLFISQNLIDRVLVEAGE